MRLFSCLWCPSTSRPASLAVPSVGGRRQVRTRVVVVFPAPLGPRNPTIWPFSTSKEISSTATVRAYRLVKPSTLIILICPQTEQTWLDGTMSRRTALLLNIHHRERGEVLSIVGFGLLYL